MTDKADVLICGGGIIGLTIARELLRKGYDNIVILEKEKRPIIDWNALKEIKMKWKEF